MAGIRLFFICKSRQIVHAGVQRQGDALALLEGRMTFLRLNFGIVTLVDAGKHLHFDLRIALFLPQIPESGHIITSMVLLWLNDLLTIMVKLTYNGYVIRNGRLVWRVRHIPSGSVSKNTHNRRELKMGTGNSKRLISIILLLLVVVLVLHACSASPDRSSATCGSCGRTYAPGDSGGNYMNIARTGMCNNCYGNFEWAQSILD